MSKQEKLSVMLITLRSVKDAVARGWSADRAINEARISGGMSLKEIECLKALYAAGM